jgi:DNA-binding NtrC family response regulator
MDHSPHILFVDDEQLLHGLFERLFARHNIRVTSCSTAFQGVEELKKQEFDLVVTDFMMPDMDGLQLLTHVREHYPRIGVVMITAHANVQHAVRTMQNGAVDYIPKPFATTELVDRVQRCLARVDQAPALASPARSKKTRAGKDTVQVEYVGEHASVQRLKKLVEVVARNKAPVFIQGESGSGKEIIAKMIHQMSARSGNPYVTLNCANLPRELVESHLFGHRKGAFTGAIDDMTGAFERAHGGTLLLDEITEIDLGVQAKLLRVLQEHEFQKVGASEPQKVDVRVIATSNRRILDAIESGIFREDLYHRLAVFPINVPPLREHLSDLPLLVDHFIGKYCQLYGLPLKRVSQELLDQFRLTSWTGNVRQLENLVQRGVLLSAEREVVESDDVFNNLFNDARAVNASERARVATRLQTIDDMERHMILQALEETNQNQQLAAERLGISARTIRNKLKRYREEGHLVGKDE